MNRGAFAAILRGRQVLLVRSLTSPSFTSHWSLPGGLVEDGETYEDGAIREAIEETGVICQISELLAEVDNTEENIRVNIYRAEYYGGEINIDDLEIAEAKWVHLDEVLNLPLAYNLEEILITLKTGSIQTEKALSKPA